MTGKTRRVGPRGRLGRARIGTTLFSNLLLRGAYRRPAAGWARVAWAEDALNAGTN